MSKSFKREYDDYEDEGKGSAAKRNQQKGLRKARQTMREVQVPVVENDDE